MPLLALASACLPPGTAVRPSRMRVRVHEPAASTAAATVATGTLVRLTPDSVAWTPSVPSGASLRVQPLTALARVELGEILSQGEAFRRGALRGGVVGALLGGGLLALRHDAVGGAIGLTALGAWVGGVGAGQSVESSDPPTRWRTVHPSRTR